MLLVCLGNICRSPLAEVIMRKQAMAMQLDQIFEFASAGTGDWHLGKGADPRSIRIAKKYHLSLHQHQAQHITSRSINDWDCLIAMDQNNKSDLLKMGVAQEKLLLMRQFEGSDPIKDVPDPYYGGEKGFETIYQLLQNNAGLMLHHLSTA
ncbi:MAG: low molecular weight protein-tyrosine-phosphatase [Mariprofundaceae bacterium]|nr:low molecular weight protein-tyrosine-phosphatase [Mariprofundaceae bacterium]